MICDWWISIRFVCFCVSRLVALFLKSTVSFTLAQVTLLSLIKTAQLTVRGLLSRPPPRFSLQEPPRARFIPESHDVPDDEGFPGLLPYLSIEIDQALTGAALLSCQATTSNLRYRHRKGRGRKEKGEGIREGGKGPCSPFPFRAFLPLNNKETPFHYKWKDPQNFLVWWISLDK